MKIILSVAVCLFVCLSQFWKIKKGKLFLVSWFCVRISVNSPLVTDVH